MKEIERYLKYIKSDFAKNKVKLAVLFLAITMWTIGFVNPVAEHTGHLFSEIYITLSMLIGYFLIFSLSNITGFVKKHTMGTLVLCTALFLLVVVYKKVKSDYPIENDMILFAAVIYGTLPFAVTGKKTYGTILTATITAICVATLARQNLWWSAMVYMYVGFLMQGIIAIMGIFGGKTIVRFAETCILNALLINVTLFLTLDKMPQFPISFEPLSKIELLSLIILCAYFVLAANTVLRYKTKNYFAISALIAMTVQAFLFVFSRNTPELIGYLGLPFTESDVLNRTAVISIAVGITLSTPTVDNPIALKKIFNKKNLEAIFKREWN